MFDWQTDDDESVWEEVSTQAAKTAVFPKRRWWGLLLIAGLVLVSGLFVYRQLKQQTETAVANVEADILSTHHLVQTAAENRDVDLFRVLLSGRDLTWVDAQEQLTANALIFDRFPFSLDLQAVEGLIVETNIAPALDTAELVFDHNYVTTTPDGESETVTLRHTAVYRRGRTRWLLSPPDETFWGEWEVVESDRFILIFPSRDGEIARELFADLSTLLATVCNTLADVTCEPDRQLSLRLDKDPQSLANLADPADLFAQGLRLELPAPSLIGLPVDERSYEALYRGYGALLVTAVLADATGWSCCEGLPLFTALTDYQLAQLGLQPWAVTIGDHFALWESEKIVTLENLLDYWDSEEVDHLSIEDRLFLYTAVDFLIRQFPRQSPASMQHLMSLPGMNFNRWISSTFGERFSQEFDSRRSILNNLDQEWRIMTQIYQAASTSEEPPIPLPNQDIQLICFDESAELTVSSLWRYSLDTGEWLEEIVENSFMLMFTLANDESIILLQLQFEQDVQQAQLQIWNQGSKQILARDERYIISLGQMDPTGRYLYSYVQPFNELTTFPEHVLHDLADCSETGCVEQQLPGMPIWSPSGEKLIYMDTSFLSIAPTLPDGRVWLVDSLPIDAAFRLSRTDRFDHQSDQIEIGLGFSPFWLDDETYGFVQNTAEFDQSVIIASTSDDQPQTLLKTADLLSELPQDVVPRRIMVNYILPDPNQGDTFILVASDFNFNGYIFRVNRRTGRVALLLESGSMFRHVIGFSPNGRYLVTTRHINDQDSPIVNDFVTLYDIESNRAHDFLLDAPDYFSAFVYDWSADGQWMIIISDDGLLELMAPDYNYRTLIEHDMGVCPSVTWINR